MARLEAREPEIQIAGFRVLKKLGEGGTARVYAAVRDADPSTTVALKIFRSEHANIDDLAHRISAEVKAYRSLTHPNIVKVLEVPRDGVPALALEYIDGWTLSDFQNRLPYILPEISVCIVIEALKAVEHAHAAGIIHRDLKPSNIMISKKGRVFVTDFGLAKVTGSSISTQTGSILGSPHYMSPEQARGDIVGPRSDLFSMTSILYFLVTGTAPFNGESPLAILATVIERRLEPARQRNPKISWELSRILEKGFAKQPSQRFESAKEYREALEGYLANLGLDPEVFAVPAFLRDPHGETLRSLTTISEKIAFRCEAMIRKGRREESLELLSHLSLVAPNSQMIQELTAELDRKSSKKGWIWVAAGILLLIVGEAAFMTRNSPVKSSAPAVAPVAQVPSQTSIVANPPIPVPAAPVVAPAPEKPVEKVAEAPVKKPEPHQVEKKSPVRTEKKPVVASEKTERVNFDLPAGFTVEWDGKQLPPDQRSFQAPLGPHDLVLKVGSHSFRQKIQVVGGEPTNIRVNPNGGGQ